MRWLLSLQIDEHRQYWTDPQRVTCLATAIAQVVRPGDVVVDLASGSGILGLFACRAGASKVYSIDGGGMVSIGRNLALANGFADRMTVIKGFSTQVSLPEKADVLIADQIGNFGFNAGLFEFYADAVHRFLKPLARTLPESIALELAPWESDSHHQNVEFWSGVPYGFDTGSVLPLAQNTGYQDTFSPEGVLGSVIASPPFTLNPPTAGSLVFSGVSTFQRTGSFHGVVGWFRANLTDNVEMTNNPLVSHRIQRRQVFFPFRRSIPVAPGETLRLDVAAQPVEILVNLRARIYSAAGECKFDERHSTFLGMLLPAEDLQRTDPAFKPRLTRRGLARRDAIALFDGNNSVASIAQVLLSSYPDLFSSEAPARLFVTEITTRYSE